MSVFNSLPRMLVLTLLTFMVWRLQHPMKGTVNKDNKINQCRKIAS